MRGVKGCAGGEDRRGWWWVLVLLLVSVGVACGENEATLPPPDGSDQSAADGTVPDVPVALDQDETAAEVSDDATGDLPSEADLARDAPVDLVPDGAEVGPADVAPDLAPDAVTDLGEDAPADVAPDSPADGVAEVSQDVAPEVTQDVAPEVIEVPFPPHG